MNMWTSGTLGHRKAVYLAQYISDPDYDELKRRQDQRLKEDLTPRRAPPSRRAKNSQATWEQVAEQLRKAFDW
jgi:hypothetical protein